MHVCTRNALCIVCNRNFFSVGAIWKRLRAPIKITMSILEGNIMRSRFWSEWSAWFCRNVMTDYSGNGM